VGLGTVAPLCGVPLFLHALQTRLDVARAALAVVLLSGFQQGVQ
jgi:hypothetical protein